jgi:hypothetical protein
MKIFTFLFPVIIFFIFLCIKIISPEAYLLLIREDTAMEYIQAIFCFVSSIIAFKISTKFIKNKMILKGLLYGIFAIGLLFVSFEEISWGQRIFHIYEPAYFAKNNTQKELTIHNLKTVQPLLIKLYIIIGFYGAFAWIVVSKLSFLKKNKYLVDIFNYIVPVWYISPYFFFVFFIYSLFYLFPPHLGSFLIYKDQEPPELLLSLGFLIFVIYNYYRVKTIHRDPGLATSGINN